MREVAERWLIFAYDDLRAARAVFDKQLHNQACFHAQQCVEKSLKAVLAFEGAGVPRTHSISELMRTVSSAAFSVRHADLVSMDDYYIATRYPDALPGTLPSGLPTLADAEQAIEVAVFAFERAIEVTGVDPR